MKITDTEIKELIRIVESSDFYYGIKISEIPNMFDEEPILFWCEQGEYVRLGAYEGYFKKEKFTKETKDKIYIALKNFEGIISIVPQGTHCGTLTFKTCWVHTHAKEEDLEEAVMPQRGL